MSKPSRIRSTDETDFGSRILLAHQHAIIREIRAAVTGSRRGTLTETRHFSPNESIQIRSGGAPHESTPIVR